MLRVLGAHAVGMSTVMETIALRALGVRVGAMSCITNLAAGLSEAVLDHHDVQATARAAEAAFLSVLTRWVERCGALAGSTEAR
jgi:purine-nucleoside phosphorylase